MSFSSRDNVELAIDKIQTKLANKSDWKQRYKALEELENLVQTGFNEEGEVFVSIFMDALMHSELRRIFPSSFVDLRSEILRQASSTLSVMAECLKGKMTGLLDLLTNNLILACSKVNKVIRRYAIPAMHDVIENVPSKRMLKPLILSIQQTKSKQMRPIFTQFLQAALENWPTRTLSSKSVEIENCIKFAIECPTGQTRDAAARCYFLYVKHFPKKSKHFLGRLPSRGKQLIERMQGQDTPVPKHASPAKERKSGRPGTPKRISRISSSLSSRPSSRPSSAAGLSRRSSSRNGPKRPTSSQKSTRAGGTGRRRPGSRSGGKNRSTPPPSESRRPATATTASMRGGSNLSRKTTIAVTKAFTPKTPPRPKKSTSQTPQFLSTGHIPRPTFMSKSQGSSPMDTSSPIRQKRHSYHASTDNPLMASTYTADRSRGSSMPDNPLARQSLSARFTREASPSRRRGLSADTGAHSRDSSPELFTETRSRHSLGRASGKDLNETSIPNIGTIVGLQSDDSTHDSGSGDGKMQSRAEMEEDPQGGVAKSVVDTVTSVTSEPVKSRSRRKSHRRNISLTPLVPAAADAILAALQGSNKGVNRSDNGDSKGLGVSTCDNGVSAAVSIAETEVGVVPSSSIQDLLSATATQPPELERSLSDTPLVDTCGSSGPMSPPARRKVQGQGSRPLPKQSFALDAESIATIMKTKEISQGGTRSSSKLRRPSNVVISGVNAVAESPQPQSTQASDTLTADKRMKEKIPRPPSAGNGGGRGSKVTQGLPTYMLVIKRYQKQVMGLWNQYNRDEIAAETFSSKVVEVLGQQLSRTSSLIEKLKDAAKSTQKPRADARDSELKQPGSLLKQLSGSDITES